MTSRIKTFDYLSRPLKRKDVNGELQRVMEAMDVAFEPIVEKALLTAWDIERADRDELFVMNQSVGLHPQNFMNDDTLRKYLRTSGRIKELKGTDNLIAYLVDTLTKFKVYEVSVDENNQRVVEVKLYYGTHRDFEYQQKVLDFMINHYRKLLYDYSVTYISIIEEIWASPITIMPTATVIKETAYFINFEEYIFPQPFVLEPFKDLNTSPFWVTETKDKEFHRLTKDNFMSYDINSKMLTKDRQTIILPPAITSKLTVVSNVEEEFLVEPTFDDRETVRMQSNTTSLADGEIHSSDFKTPFHLVTM